jgi:hypothetical protein
VKNREIKDYQGKIGEGEMLARQFNQMKEEFRKIVGENRDLHGELK